MTTLSTRTFTQIVSSQIVAMQGRCAKLLDFSVGSVLRALTESNAGLSLWLQGEILKVLLATRAATSTGADLDTFVGDYGLTRLGAASAVGQVTFSRFSTSAQAVIPLNAVVESDDGLNQFIVALDATHPAYNAGLGGYVIGAGISSLSVPVAAINGGAQGNVLAHTISTIVSQITYVDTVDNAAAFVGGTDEETDPALRVRFRRFIASLSRGTLEAIRFAVTSLKVGITATIIEGAAPDGTPVDGMITVTVDDGSGNPSGDLITNAMAAVDAYRAAGIRWAVAPPIVLTVDTYMQLTVADGYLANTLIDAVGVTLKGYLDTLPLGDGVSYTRLAQVAYGVSAGITNVRYITLNGATFDIAGNDRVKIMAGTVAVA